MINLIGWLNRNVGMIRRAIVRQLGAATALPYCAAYALTTPFAASADFKVGAYNGLIAWHVVQDSSGFRVVCYWQDKQHYDYARGHFEAVLNLVGAVEWSGAAGDLHAIEPQWWPSSAREAAIAIAALIGAVSVISTATQKAYDWALATPQLTVSSGTQELKIPDRQSLPIAITVINTGFAPAEVDAEAQLSGSNISPQPVGLDRPGIPTVEKNGSVVLNATIKAPSFKPVLSSKPDYVLSVQVSGRTAFFRTSKAFPPVAVPVTVFPPLFGWTHKPQRLPNTNPDVYAAEGYLYNGKPFPAGLQATVSFDAPQTTDLVVNIPDFQPVAQALTPSPPSADGTRTFFSEFTSPNLDLNEKHRFVILISPKQGTAPPPRWDAVADSLDIEFSQ